jgi:hypothetical protein
MTDDNLTRETLANIESEMAELCTWGDIEAGHSRADKLLILTLKAVTPVEYRKLVWNIIAYWNEVEKWYACPPSPKTKPAR